MAIINGTNLSNILNGTSSADTVFGDSGSDVISGGLGADILIGGINSTFGYTINNPAPVISDYFGYSLTVGGNYAVIGVPNDNASATDSGTAYIYNMTTGASVVILNNPTPASSDFFGNSVDISGNYAVVGAPNDDTNFTDAGSAYIYNATTGSLLFTLNNPTGAVSDFFGASVAVSGNYAVISSEEDDTGALNTGSAYIYNVTTGALLYTLNNPSPTMNDYFGTSIKVSGDYAIISSPDNDPSSISNAGSVYIYNVTTGVLVYTLDNPSPTASDWFGSSVAISGNYAAVGTANDDTGASNAGTVYVYNVTTGALLRTINNPIPTANDYFGTSVSLSGNYLLVGTPNDDIGGTDTGTVYVYDVTTGQLLKTINNPSPTASDYFGFSTAISGNNIVISSYFDDTGATDAGTIYTYTLSEETDIVDYSDSSFAVTVNLATNSVSGSHASSTAFGDTISGFEGIYGGSGDDSLTGDGNVNILVGRAGNDTLIGGLGADIAVGGINTSLSITYNNPNPTISDRFGFRTGVSLSGNYSIIGASEDDAGAANAGRAYIFNATTGSLLFTLSNPAAASNDLFGISVAIFGNYAVVGADADNAGASDAGSAYVYNVTTGALVYTFNNPAPAVADYFGNAVAVSGIYAAVAAAGNNSAAGSVYIYDLTTGSLAQTINNPTPSASFAEYFGNSVAISGENVLISAFDETGAIDTGSVYVYNARTGSLLHTLNNPTPAESDWFGESVGVSGDYAIIGAPNDDTSFTDSGAAYIYNIKTGALVHTLNNPSAAANDYFGDAVAISEKYAVVGAWGDDTGASNAGTVYVYDVVTGTLLATINNPSATADDNFGFAVSISGNKILISCDLDDAGASDSGTVYQYTIDEQTDIISYSDSTNAVTVDLALQSISGSHASSTAFADTISGFENAIGGTGDDVLTAAYNTTSLTGGDGHDTLNGRFTHKLVIDAAKIYALAEGTGTTSKDYIANTSDVTLQNGAAWGANNQGRAALELKGATDNTGPRASVASMTIGGDITFSAYVRFDDLAGVWQRIFDFGEGQANNNINFGQRVGSSGVRLQYYNGTTSSYSLNSSDGVLVAGEWAHWTVTLSATGLATIYKDGVQIAQTDHGVALNTVTRTSNYIGASNWSTDDAINGAISDFAIYDRALTATEVSNLYQYVVNGNGLGSNNFLVTNKEITLDGGNGNDVITGSTSSDTLTGGSGADTLTGVSGADTFNGGTGDDYLDGGSGADIIAGDDGNDTILGGSGIDTVTGGIGNDSVRGGGGADSLDGGSDIDTLDYSDSTNSVVVNLATNSITGSHASSSASGDTITNFENVIGGTDADTLTGTSSANVLTGNNGNDTLKGGLGADVLDGGSGTDLLDYSDSTNAVVVNLTTNSVTGSHASSSAFGDTITGFENITASTSADTLTGDGNANTISASDGNDSVTGGLGADVLDGGTGTDSLDYSDSTNAVTVNLATNSITGSHASSSASGDTITNFENVIGGTDADTLTGTSSANVLTGNNGNDTLKGGLGADVLDGGSGTDTLDYSDSTNAVTVNLATNSITGSHASSAASGDTITGFENITASTSADMLTGDGNANTISASAGNDSVTGGLGADVLDGGTGTDTLDYSDSTNAVTVNLTTNSITGSHASSSAFGDTITGFENITASTSADTLTGDGNANTISASGGNDTVKGGLGADVLDGGSDIDTLDYSDSTNSVVVNLATNSITGSHASSSASGDTIMNFENVIGSSNVDTLTGNTVANSLSGLAGNDIISGGDGNDTVTAGLGSDTLDGGSGTDMLDYSDSLYSITINLLTQSVTGSHTNSSAYGDVITSFESATGGIGNDTLTGNSSDNALVGGDGSDTIISGTGADVLDGGNGTDTLNYYDSTTSIVVNLATNSITGSHASSSAFGDTITNFENVIGGSDVDTLTGNIGANSLSGLAGNDIISGGDGNDTITAGLGSDTLDGGAGTDTLNYADSTKSVIVNLITQSVTGSHASSSAFGDTITGFENATGGSDVDTLIGNNIANILSGSAGNDTIMSGLGADTLDGGTGIDSLDYSSEAVGVVINLTTGVTTGSHASSSAFGDTAINFENVIGSSDADNFTGNTSNNILTGLAGNDIIDGADANDTLKGGVGSDDLTGGAGVDTVDYSDSTTFIVVNLALNSVAGSHATSTAFGDTITGFENIQGGMGNDILTGTSAANMIAGNGGNDIITAGEGADVIDGGAGWDILDFSDLAQGLTMVIGSSGGYTTSNSQKDTFKAFEEYYLTAYADTVTGGKSNEVFAGSAGGDTINGNTGIDTVDYSNSTAITLNFEANTYNGGYATGDMLSNIENIIGSSQNDTIIGKTSSSAIDNNFYGGEGNDYITGGHGKDKIYGENGDDSLYGGAGDDWIYAGDGSNVSYGEAGNDIFVVEEGNIDIINGGTGSSDMVDFSLVSQFVTVNFFMMESLDGAVNKTFYGIEDIRGSDYNDILTGDTKINKIFGGIGHDTIAGGSGNDILQGEIGNDIIHGGIGNDTILGGIGADIITGAAGKDIFMYNNVIETSVGNLDNITDFVVGQDVINIAKLVSDIAGFSDLNIALDTGSTYDVSDASGSGFAMKVTILGAGSLSASSFVFG